MVKWIKLIHSFGWKDWLFLIALSATAILAFALLRFSTPVGLGMVNDTFAYVAGARNILAGNGYSRIAGGGEIKPITHFPPMFSIVLAFMGLSGIDVIRLARLGILLWFASGACLVGIQVRLITRSRWWGILGAAFFMASSIFLQVYAMLMSEPLFIFLSLASSLGMALFVGRGQYRYLIIAGILAGMATLTRYAGVALFLTTTLTLWMFAKDFRRFVRNGLVYALGGGGMVALWLVHNLVLTGVAANRRFLFHPIDVERLSVGCSNFWDWLLPGTAFDRLMSIPWLPGLLSSGIGLLVLFASVKIWINLRAQSQTITQFGHPSNIGPALFVFHSIYIWVYLLIILATMTFYDFSTTFENRILAPLEVSFLIVVFSLVFKAWSSRSRIVQSTVLIFLAIAGYFWVDEGWHTVESLRQNGLGFASVSWRSSKTINLIRSLPEEMIIYSNRQTAIYLLSGRSAYVLPTPIDPSTGLRRPNYQEELNKMRIDIASGRAVMIFFYSLEDASKVEASEWFNELRQGLTLWYQFGDSKVYGNADTP